MSLPQLESIHTTDWVSIMSAPKSARPSLRSEAKSRRWL